MRIQKKTRTLAGLAGFMAGFPIMGAHAISTTDEIRLLKAQLKRLEAKVEAQDREQKETKHEVRRVVETQTAKRPAGLVPVATDGDAPWPDRFYYKGVTIKPGGFLEFAALHRSRYIGADLATPFQNIPYQINPTSHTDEFRFTPRRSRFTLTVDGDVNPAMHVTGYLEMDFLGAGQTANLNQSDSWNLRYRQLYGQIDWKDFGIHFLAGQAVTLMMMNSNGVLPATVLVPPVIDDQYMPGFVWARQAQVRLVKDIGKEIQVGVSAEASQTTYIVPGADLFGRVGPCLNGNVVSLPGVTPAVSCNGGLIPGAFNQAPVGGSLYNALNPVTLNRIPDFQSKVAWDPTIFDRHIHFEAFGILRDFTDRAWWGNHSIWGGGFGAGMIVPVIPKWLDFQVSGIIGRGLGRYGAAQINDATFTPTGSTLPIHERMIMIGLTAHPTPQTDVYVFAGGEFASRQYTFSRLGNTVFSYGYGNPLYTNIGCDVEQGGLPCVGQIKSIRQITSGLWHNFYEGPWGKIRAGVQYSYTTKDAFQGFGRTPKAEENMVFTSLRYIPF